jgi:hypothetical protein
MTVKMLLLSNGKRDIFEKLNVHGAFGVWRLDVTQFRKFSRVFVTLGKDLSGEILLANLASRCLSAG